MNINTIQSLLLYGAKKLSHLNTPHLDARILLQEASNLKREQIHLEPDIKLQQEIIELYKSFIERRVQNEPVAKIIGKKAFWKDEFIVTKDTLDPRPDSETLISGVLEIFPDQTKALKILDLGTGSGCLILSLLREYPNAYGIASDLSIKALKVAKQNAESLGFNKRISFIQQSWAEALKGEFDLIISNPPYIATDEILELEKDVKLYDPLLALDGGKDGLDPYRYLADNIYPLLKKEAYVILEFGYGQSVYIQEKFIEKGYFVYKILQDLAFIERAIIVRRNYEPGKIHRKC